VNVPLADVTFTIDDDVVVASVIGEIDMSNAPDLADALAGRLKNESRGLVLDLTACDYVDSAGIHVLYELHERLRNRGLDLRIVVGTNAAVAPALEVADVLRAMGSADSVQAAIASLRG
jgi:anti-anti-sigma factor